MKTLAEEGVCVSATKEVLCTMMSWPIKASSKSSDDGSQCIICGSKLCRVSGVVCVAASLHRCWVFLNWWRWKRRSYWGIFVV